MSYLLFVILRVFLFFVALVCLLISFDVLAVVCVCVVVWFVCCRVRCSLVCWPCVVC